jgi:hypothetical protein
MNPTQHTRLTDQEILKHFYADHNNEWLGPLLERYTMLLYGVCMKYLKNPEEARDAIEKPPARDFGRSGGRAGC